MTAGPLKSMRPAHAPRSVLLSFMVGMLGGVAFAVCYALDLGNIAFGASLGVAFAALSFGLVRWSKLIEHAEPVYVEERSLEPSPPAEWEHFREALTEQPVPRSRALWSMFALALGTVGLAALFPVRSLLEPNSDPDRSLSRTAWRRGRHVVKSDGTRVRATDLDYGSVETVYAEGASEEFAADATMLFRVPPASLQLPAKRRAWVVDGVVGYSRLCTHAGCPVGLYDDQARLLMCPCHHSIFNVLDGAQPVSGPAPRALPQLPLGVDADGYLVALGGFTQPPGPGWWGFYK